MADKNFRVKNGLEVGGTEIDLAQGTTIEYSENNNRNNRPVIKSTTGNTSGLRVEAPNATTSAVATIAAFSTNDGANGKFLSVQARGDLTTPLRIQSGQYTAGVLSATTDLVNFIDGSTVYATVNPNGIINNSDLTTKLYVDSLVDEDTKYTIDASSTTGGANLNLAGSDLTTDTVKFSSGGATTVSQVNANEIEINSVNTTYTQDVSSETGGAGINLVGSDSTTDTITIVGGTNVTVTATDASTITIDAPDTNTTYTIDASSTTGGANLNLVGSDATTDTVKFAEGTGIDVVQTDANTITTSLNASIDDLTDVVITSAADGQILYYNGTNWVNSATIDSPNLTRARRNATGTGNNAILELNRNRTDGARATDFGPWLGFAYQATDNTQATSPQNAIRSMYDSTGNNKLQFLQLPGTYATPTVISQTQRGAHFFNSTTGFNILNLADGTIATRANAQTFSNNANTSTYLSLAPTIGSVNQDTFTIKNTAGTTTYASFASGSAAITSGGLTTVTRTTAGTPGVAEQRPAFNIQLTRTDQTTPNDDDSVSFRYRVAGSNGTNYTLADLASKYDTAGDVMWAIQLANGDQTGATFSGLTTLMSSITKTTVSAGTASGTPGGSSVAQVAEFSPTGLAVTGDISATGRINNYDKVYGEFAYTNAAGFGFAAQNTIYTMPLDTTFQSSDISISGTGTITFAKAQLAKIIISLQSTMTTNSVGQFDFWLRKNGSDVANSKTQVDLLKDQKSVIAMDWMVDAAASDYYEIVYASASANYANIAFPTIAATTTPFVSPVAPALIVNIIPVGA